MNINNTNPSSKSSGIEPTKTNKTQTSDNVKKSNPEQSTLPNAKSSTVVSNSKLQAAIPGQLKKANEKRV